MSKEDTVSGLLSKMVKFVRNPGTNWSDLDSVQTDKDDSVSKQLLKEMIERKRRNDFVRKREFDMLRKMRKREAMSGVNQDPAGRPSFFQSSLPSKPDDRATTLKKIDEIEALMSMQWWKTKDNNVSDDLTSTPVKPAGRGSVAQAPLLDNALSSDFGPTESAEIQSSSRQAAAPRRPPEQMTTQADALFMSSATGGLSGTDEGYDSTAPGLLPSQLPTMQVGESVAHDAELEEAAIRFANGDDAGAEVALLEILRPGGAREGHAATWLMLFDLYRATGRQDKFELAAIQFVERFDRSAPQWFSMPDGVNMLSEPVDKIAAGFNADWVCPSVLGIQTVAALKAAMARAAMPWRLDWNNLKTIEEAAVEPLYKVFSAWSREPVQLGFMGDAQLQKVLQDTSPSGNRDTPQSWWQLRMEALRAMNRPDDFELVALDFCVTYEVSPPAWVNARCRYQPLDAQGDILVEQTITSDLHRDSTYGVDTSVGPDTDFDTRRFQMSKLPVVELAGQIQGDVMAVLDKLETKLMGADVMLISCTKLMRVDFSAAGTLLNWVSAREAEKRLVQFSDVNRLVASFFHVMGITEHARIVIRVD
ncbi:MAG: STAS domain-containing protein [Polaromonas sp.]|uniref:STAS domain-containing protein n=1 Tax=Polaromonas sp. TaxID=1869339 RepID=UPI0017BE7803|nr:STAS domain-containing protein [Polaromonas sp.]NMM11500.1 STAS domain-containing protein [Polaromonas sp.]